MDYRDTLCLPKTDFPMKANLPLTEPKLLRRWEEMDLYGKIRIARKGKPKFVLHDGPPYANGHIHAGTALNKIVKDIIVKVKNMEGFDAPYTPGWDCHGLPIESMVDKELGSKKHDISKSEFRKKCREYASKFVQIQKEEFQRLGVTGDWKKPYLTMNFPFEAATVRELGKFMGTNGLYKGNKPIHWCTSCQTALAEAEVEYADHTSPSIWVKFPLTAESVKKLGIESGPVPSVVIWTTTPWTLPANLAVCLNPKYPYELIRLPSGERLILAWKQAAHNLTWVFDQEIFGKKIQLKGYETGSDSILVYTSEGDMNLPIESSWMGSELEGLKYKHPFLDGEFKLILGEHVTEDQGSGCVHTAPGHGQEDYEVGLKYGLEVYNPVDGRGNFMAGTPHFAGLNVWKSNPVIIEKLKSDGYLLKEGKLTHSYPHCWRCKNPIIFRATAQWFISMKSNDLRNKALRAIDEVDWVPKWGHDRISGMVENRPDWCISRQRAWGVPITVFYCKGCEKPLFSQEIADRVASLMESDGADIWFQKGAKEFLPEGVACSHCGGKEFEKENDILDVWFDSGVTHAIVCEGNPELTWPVDLYVEGSDQHRGWFQSTLLESVGTRGRAAYKQVLTHGYVVDGAGKKMSKSLGNVISPQKVIDRYGAEILRLWVASENYREDIRLSDEILSRLAESYRKIRNTFRFMLGNLSDFDPARDAVPYGQLPEIDRLMLHRLEDLIERVRSSLSRYDFHVFYHSFNNYCTVDLSSFYLDVLKDRLYTFKSDSLGRRSAQTVLFETTLAMVRLMAPVLAFTAEELWKYIPGREGRPESVHLAQFPEPNPAHLDPGLKEKWERILEIRQETAKAIEIARGKGLIDSSGKEPIGSSLEACVNLHLPERYRDLFPDSKSKEELKFILIVSKVKFSEEFLPEVSLHRSDVEEGNLQEELIDPNVFRVYKSEQVPGLKIQVENASAYWEKCERCWNYDRTVGKVPDHETLCSRCAGHLGVSV